MVDHVAANFIKAGALARRFVHRLALEYDHDAIGNFKKFIQVIWNSPIIYSRLVTNSIVSRAMPTQAGSASASRVVKMGITDIGLYYPMLPKQEAVFERIATDTIPASKAQFG